MHAGFRAALVGVCLIAAPVSVLAVDQSFTVSAEIVPGCVVAGSAATSGLAFGELAFGTLPATAEGEATTSTQLGSIGGMQIECTAGLDLTLSIDGGQHTVGGVRHLARTGGGSTIPYVLYADAGRSQPIPSTGGLDVTVPPSGLLSLEVYAVATLPGAPAAPGTYTDTLGVEIAW